MKKKLSYLIILMFTVQYFSSCTMNEVEISKKEEIASFEDYLEFLHEETTGNVLVQAYSTENSQKPAFNISASIEGDKKPLSIEIEGQVYSFNQYEYSETKKRSFSTGNNQNLKSDELQNVFGKRLILEISDDMLKASGTTTVQTVYMPKIIQAEFTGLINNKITVGTKVKWNADGNNANGIVVALEYWPVDQYSEIADKYPEHIIKGTTLPDNGEYTFTSNDLNAFPNNANLNLYVARAGFGVTIDNTGKDYSIAAITASNSTYQIQK